MDKKAHKLMAEHAMGKVKDLLAKEYLSEKEELTLIHHAHSARMHYGYSSEGNEDEESLQNIKKADDMIVESYTRLGLEDAALWYGKRLI